MTPAERDILALLPLPLATLHILLALGRSELHGYGIMQDVGERTDGDVRLSPGTLYRTIQRLLDQGLIAESRRRPAAQEDDPRRRYYRITPYGESVARAEVARLARLVKLARTSGLAPERA